MLHLYNRRITEKLRKKLYSLGLLYAQPIIYHLDPQGHLAKHIYKKYFKKWPAPGAAQLHGNCTAATAPESLADRSLAAENDFAETAWAGGPETGGKCETR